MKKIILCLVLPILIACTTVQNGDPLKAAIITSDITHFWTAFDANPDLSAEVFQKEYIDPGSRGIKGFMKGRIQNADYFARVVKNHNKYYASIRESSLRIEEMTDSMRSSFVKLKSLYPEAIFPTVYFVIGTMNSGGTTSSDGLIIGAEMYGLTTDTPQDELTDWERSVIKPVDEVPHIVAHELVHFQQHYDGGTLLEASIKEGAADFVAELISGKHINQHVHDFANPREKELWEEFKTRMDKKDYSGWLYSGSPGRPNDLGYWMGYRITRAYYDHAADKTQAIGDIFHIRNFKKFLADSRYEERFR